MLSGPSAAEFSRLGVFIMGVLSIFRKAINTSERSGQASTEHCHPKTSMSPSQDGKRTGASVRFSKLMIASDPCYFSNGRFSQEEQVKTKLSIQFHHNTEITGFSDQCIAHTRIAYFNCKVKESLVYIF